MQDSFNHCVHGQLLPSAELRCRLANGTPPSADHTLRECFAFEADNIERYACFRPALPGQRSAGKP